MPTTIRPGLPADLPACLAIAQALPEFFNEGGLAAMAEELPRQALWVAELEGAVVGFLALKALSPTAQEIAWMAVAPERRRGGLGQGLLGAVLAALREEDVALLEVKTLAASAKYPPYEATRAFYLAQGFAQVLVWEQDSPWGPDQPCAVLQRMV